MKNTIHKALTWALVLCMVLTLMPATVIAASNPGTNTFDISEGNIKISAGEASGTVKVTYGAAFTSTGDINSTAAITIIGESISNNVLVETGVTANITLNGVKITTSNNSSAAPFTIAAGAAVNLTLTGISTLTSGTDSYAGLNVPESASLVITGASTGILNATGGKSGAGIGSCNEVNSGSIEINGGTITARCGTDASHGYGGAGIGGGQSSSGGTIIITGNANVTAVGGERAAGIGGGWCGNGGTITIGSVSGSEQPVVDASIYSNSSTASYPAGAAIGNGSFVLTSLDYDDSYNITIHGGTVTAKGHDAGIGGRSNDLPQTRSITITGGTITADASVSYDYGAGIGGDIFTENVTGTGAPGVLTINITGGTVNAKGSSSGIGGIKGADDLRSIIISGGTVFAEASYLGAGIGGGDSNTNSSITITGNAFIAKACGDRGGAGIGGSGSTYDQATDKSIGNSGGKIVISGNASIGSENYSYDEPGAVGIEGGAGIGGSCGGSGGSIEIATSGTVNATGNYGGAGIGGGSNYSINDSVGSGGSIAICGGTITATGSIMNGACGAGIGGGGCTNGGIGGSGGNITISGGTIKANGMVTNPSEPIKGASAGIGGGNNGSGGTINITGGKVEATVYNTFDYTGNTAAFIGGGSAGCSGNISISGGTVYAYEYYGEHSQIGPYDNNTNHIGHGENYTGTDGSITITGGYVRAGQMNSSDSQCAQVRPIPQNANSTPLKRVGPYLSCGNFTGISFDNAKLISLTITDANNQKYNYGIKDMYGINLWLPVGDYTASAIMKDGSTFYTLSGEMHVTESLNDRRGELTATDSFTETVSLDIGAVSAVTYNRTNQAPLATVKNAGGNILTAGTDYDLAYKKGYSVNGITTYEEVTEIINAGSYQICATGKGSYAGMSDTRNFTVCPATVSTACSSTAVTKVYDGTRLVKNAGGETISSIDLTITGGVISPDSITNVKLINPEYLQAGVGASIAIQGTVTCAGNDNYNYTLEPPANLTGSITTKVIGESDISQGTLTITKTYDGTVSSATAHISGSLVLKDSTGQEAAAVSVDSYSDFNNKDAGTNKTVTVTLGSLSGTNAANFTLAGGAANFTATATITPADYSYTAVSPQEYIPQGSRLSAIEVPSGGVGVTGELVPGTLCWYKDASRTQSASDSDISSLAAGSTATLYLSFTASDPNYTATPKTGSVTLTIVEGAKQDLSFGSETAITKTYGDPSFAKTAVNTTSGGGIITYSSSNPAVAEVNTSSGAITITGSGTAVISAAASAVPSIWARTTANYTLTVNKKAIVITADNNTKTYGTANPPLTFTYSQADLIGNDTAADLVVTLSCSAGTVSPAGTPVVITGSSGSTKYTVSIIPGELTILKANQSAVILSLSSPTAVKGLSIPTLTASGGNGMGNYIYTGGDAAVATVNTSTGAIKVVGAGTATFSAIRLADTNYNEATSSAAIMLTVSNKTDITVRDTAAVKKEILPQLPNQGKINVGKVTRTGLNNEFSVAVTGTSALTSYEVSSMSKGTAKWLALLIGNLCINDGPASTTTSLYYRKSGAASYTKLTAADAAESLAAGGTANEFVLWFNTDTTLSETVWLATSDTGANETKLNIGFTPYTAPSTGETGNGGNGGNSGSGTGSTGGIPVPKATDETGVSENGGITTATAAITASADAKGKVSVKVEASTIDKLVENARTAESKGKNSIIELKLKAVDFIKDAEISIPKDAFDTLTKETKASLKIDTGAGSVVFDAKAVNAINSSTSSGNVIIRISTVDNNELPDNVKGIVGDHPVYDFSVSAGTSRVSSFGGGTASISVPYTLKTGEDENAVIVYYIDDSGKLQTIRGAYNAAAGTVDFTVSHFSRYAVGYNKLSFTDVNQSAWYSTAVTFISARGISTGTSRNCFNPDAAVTRAQFIVMLMRAYGIAPDEKGAANFADAGNSYYTNYLAAAKHLNLASGTGSNLFRPDDNISRQDMLTLLHRALKLMGELPTTSGKASLSNYTDASSIPLYAKTAVESLVASGIVTGGNGKLKLTDCSTRAQIAQLLYNLLSNGRKG